MSVIRPSLQEEPQKSLISIMVLKQATLVVLRDSIMPTGYNKDGSHNGVKTRFQKGSQVNLGKKNALGKLKSQAIKDKMSRAMKGIPKSEEHKRKISERMKGLKGKLTPNWRGGLSQEVGYSKRWSTLRKEKVAGRRKPEQCEICGAIDCMIVFDHCHKSGNFRGWICSRCNFTLGLAKDSVEILELMIKYLNANNKAEKSL